MDNCDLEKIAISVGTLDPPFQPSITRYKVTVPSNINELNLNLQTSDCGASYRIRFGDGSHILKVDDGMNQVDIEVVAEDGTSQIYCIEVTKLSASTVKLEDLTVTPDAQLHPAFSANIYEYSCLVNFYCDAIIVLPKIPDSNMRVSVNGSDVPGPTPLAVGDTRIECKVCSADGTKSQMYTVQVTRKEIPFAFTFNDVKDQLEYECPVSLTAFYRPVSVSPSEPKHTFSSPYIDMLTRRSKVDPLNELPLKESWRVPELDLDRRMSAALVQCPFHYRGCESLLSLSEAGSHAKGCPCRPPLKLDPKEVTGTEWYKKHFASSNKLEIETKHTVEMRSWEIHLQTAIGADDVGELCRHADAQLRRYRERLPEPGHLIQYEDGRVLLDCLERAAVHYASALRLKPRDPRLHLLLGRVLEQLHYADEMHGLRRQVEEDALDLESAKAAGKEDEVLAICKLHGFSGQPTLQEQLKALDAEYRQLREQGLPAKADYIQTLFIWLSKRMGKGGRAGCLGEASPLQQALLKFLDAWSLSPDDWELNLHAGRLLLQRGHAREALQHLRTGLALQPSHAPLRFYTGLAMLEQDGDPKNKVEAALYLQQGLEHFIMQCCSPDDLARADKQNTADLLSLKNTQFLQGCLSLGTLLMDCRPPGKAMSSDQVFHTTAVLAARSLCGCMCRGEVARQMDWVLLDAHFALLQALLQAQVSAREAWVARRCQALNSLIRLTTIAPCRELLDLQEKVCRIGVVATPHSSHALCLLGQVQLAQHDDEPYSESGRSSLADCLLSFRASIELEGAAQAGPTPSQLAGQKWWQDHLAKKEMEKSANQTAPPPGGAHRGSGVGVAGRGVSRARGMLGRGCATAPEPSQRTGKPASQPAKATPPVASRRCTGAKPKCIKMPCKTTSKSQPTHIASKPVCQSSEEKLKPQAPKAVELVLDHNSSSVSMMPNCWSHVPRLGLARALSRSASTTEEACTIYQEVITAAPEVHDAYIELADLLVTSDPLAAVDVYCKFPLRHVSEQNFDDAFITGEIVRILMKEEQFDHPQLSPNLIAYGKIMGPGCLEKYIDILEGKFKTNLLKTVYAGIHDKPVEDKDLQDFYNFKCWI